MLTRDACRTTPESFGVRRIACIVPVGLRHSAPCSLAERPCRTRRHCKPPRNEGSARAILVSQKLPSSAWLLYNQARAMAAIAVGERKNGGALIIVRIVLPEWIRSRRLFGVSGAVRDDLHPRVRGLRSPRDRISAGCARRGRRGRTQARYNGSKNFLSPSENWAERAARLGWDAMALFGCAPKRPLDYLGSAGLLWAINGGRLLELHRDWAVIDVPVLRSKRIFSRRNVDPAQITLPWAKPTSSRSPAAFGRQGSRKARSPPRS
jgi:hypothetical protein